ncbi:MAG: aminopeptidase P family protein [candidate division Zixibacteria bacterium]|nr:aminopeptidase P family protein [candidate division Zixibacteria bacterium]
MSGKLEKEKLDKIQRYLKDENLDGWLLADFHARNTIAVEFLDLSMHMTRRWFYLIPAEGEPVALINMIEKERFASLPGKKLYFTTYQTLEENIPKLLQGAGKLAMEYSRFGRLPYVGLVDAGTIELIRSYGVEVVSSADIVAGFQARLTERQVKMHKDAAIIVNCIKDDAFKHIKEFLDRGQTINERMVVDFMMKRFEQEEMTTDFAPICAVDANICNPHYDSGEEKPSDINKDSLILIDLWAKFKKPHAVFADITWMAYAGEVVPEKYAEEFKLISSARDAAVSYLWEKNGQTDPVFGYEVDNACRKVISDAGYGKYFFHRVGHSILEEGHGPGPNIDNIETKDRRKLHTGHLFSIEPGIYLEDHGMRTEINLLMTEDGPEVTTQPIQQEIIPLLG